MKVHFDKVTSNSGTVKMDSEICSDPDLSQASPFLHLQVPLATIKEKTSSCRPAAHKQQLIINESSKQSNETSNISVNAHEMSETPDSSRNGSQGSKNAQMTISPCYS